MAARSLLSSSGASCWGAICAGAPGGSRGGAWACRKSVRHELGKKTSGIVQPFRPPGIPPSKRLIILILRVNVARTPSRYFPNLGLRYFTPLLDLHADRDVA